MDTARSSREGSGFGGEPNRDAETKASTPPPSATSPPGSTPTPAPEKSSSRIQDGEFDGYGAWRVDTDFGDVTTLTHTVNYTAAIASRRHAGDTYLVLGVTTGPTRAIAWVEQRVDFTPLSTVTLNTAAPGTTSRPPVCFAGKKPRSGLDASQFTAATQYGDADPESWSAYRYDVSDVSGSGTLAIGVTSPPDSDLTLYIDSVSAR